MPSLTSVPFGTFLLLYGIMWVMKPIQPPDPEDVEDYEKAMRSYHRARRRRALFSLVRISHVVAGALILTGHMLSGLGWIDEWRGFLLLTGLYSTLLLTVQRAEVNRRLATLLMTGVVALLVERYAVYKDWSVESNWSIYAALGLNYLFWLTLGRKYPPHSSEEIKVWGMDMT